MTTKEAISIIQREYSCVDRECNIERSCGKCDLMMPSKEPILEAFNMAINILEQQKPCEDAISRRAALGCCRNEWEEEVEIRLKSLPPVGVAFGFGEKYDEMDKVMEEVKKIITPDQQPCEDAISRQAVLDEAFEVDTKEYGRIDVVGVDAIVALPPVTSQLKTGHWIVYDHGCGVKYYQCSICKGFDGDVKGKYCKWCGAKMVELHESEDKKC